MSTEPHDYSIAEALKAQKALRTAAGLPDETFPLPAFIGMVSDEIESLRARGNSDQQIAELIRSSSAIDVTPEQIAQFYATPEERGHHGR